MYVCIYIYIYIYINCNIYYTFLCICNVMHKIKYNTDSTTDFHQQRPTQNLTSEVVRQGIQYYTLEMDQTTTHSKLNKEEKMEVDRSHTLGKSQETITSQATRWSPLGRGEVVHETPGRDTERETRDALHEERDGEDGHGRKTVAVFGQ